MNKEELIKLKEKLVKLHNDDPKKYGRFDSFESSAGDDYSEEELMSKVEIVSKVDTNAAVKYLEDKIEKITVYLAVNGIDFDEINVEMMNEFYVTEDFLNRRSEAPKSDELFFPKKNEVVDNITPIEFLFNCYNNGSKLNLPDKLNMEDESPSFVVNYNEFVQKMKELGYQVKATTFDDKYLSMFEFDGFDFENICVDFREKNNKTL